MNDFHDIVLPVLRVYQDDLTDRTRALIPKLPTPKRVILQAATGAGKSVIGLNLILSCYLKGKRSLFIVSGRALVNQFADHLTKSGVPFGIIMSGHGTNPSAPVQLASKETLTSRSIRRAINDLPDADLVIIDEAHDTMAKEWRLLLDHYKDKIVIGLTATPVMGNGKGLGEVWNGLEKCVSIQQLVNEGWLVPCRVFAPEAPDLKGVRVEKNGDYNVEQLAQRMNRPRITGNVLTNWRKHADGLKTVIFGCTIDHAKNICAEFNNAGIPFRHIDQETEDDERDEIFGLIRDGKVMGFTNVTVASRGLDLPCLECAGIVRPTRSIRFWLQMLGRVRRPWPGKSGCIVIDHSGACDRLCMPDDELDWTLDANRRINDWLDEQKEAGKIAKQTPCPECSCMFTGPRCPSCGYTMKASPRPTKPVEYADGILVERLGVEEGFSYEEMQRHWNKCIAIAVHRGSVLGAAAAIFGDKFKRKPWEVEPPMRNMPADRSDWKRPAAEVFPGFKRVKVKE